MLERYISQTDAEQNRLEIVKAALEIAKAAVGATGANSGIKSGHDLDNVINKIDQLADAIQAAIQKK
ncbi:MULTISPECIES: hypothetical protein [Klebsiella pneumoniae complex]|uniref:hypothetical protein n=1 Tax=Klebsiella pneumoniae complex TaxID=3390273 RepID=UPI000DF118AF|nr:MULTISPECIES: hypothetical protein [Klebsiella]HCI6751825.1 hypothetical protein [Klebsiella quasipneumoniae subsp. quasipneumoniae]HDH1245040.1 hypothetical protein [Klebsiella variicola subsp. variicola]HDT2350817.1 hypothetical protein [Klebsiella pneumoniae subsp. pneumoniae]MBX4717914.1 hypothetical protein [Klebsiella pneumoniae]MBZ7521663.1 hypothetical protein [Klebsiella variicola]